MNSTVSVSVKGLLVSGLVLLALGAAYLLGGAGGTTGGPAHAADQPHPAASDARTLRMVGTGEATVVPDQLTFTLAVTAKQPGLDQALAGSSATMDRVLARLEESGIRKGDVQTTGLQMYPEYDYPTYGPPVLSGYRVTQKARVTVRDLARGGRAVSAAIDSGGNAVRATDLRLGVSDPEAALRKARDAAVEAATAKAEQYAAATGQALGDVLGLREVSADAGAGRARRDLSLERAAAYADRALPIEAGKQDLGVTVEVLWAFSE
ncbi:MAG: SIMPL domain-containing protein [Nocardioides sp.]